MKCSILSQNVDTSTKFFDWVSNPFKNNVDNATIKVTGERRTFVLKYVTEMINIKRGKIKKHTSSWNLRCGKFRVTFTHYQN